MNCVLSKSFARCYQLHEGQSKIFRRTRWTKLVKRSCSTATNPKSGPLFFHRLINRAVIRVAGQDAAPFLQGLMTNDVRHLGANDKGPPPKDCIYSMLLNQQGRVLYDLLVYKTATTSPATGDTFLLECDRSLSSDLIRHLTTFKIRKKVAVTATDDRTAVWCLFHVPDSLRSIDSRHDNAAVSAGTNHPAIRGSTGVVLAVSSDPRQRALGIRVVLSDGATPPDVVTDDIQPDEDELYRLLRYRLGVAEGAAEIPSGAALPLEYNADYLHGVSFQKGCYIGQELTARIHHTGVVRKRLLPLVLADEESSKVDGSTAAVVVNEQGKTVGRPSAVLGRFGIGVMRLQECLLDGVRLTMEAGGTGVRTYRPFWWPAELPKENLAASNK